ncbi:YwqG family protein [Xanthomonas sp. CFBP 8445]|uniref:YwqG family protein n=1 Tax=Xanthomonas sp. CFBP 8445 TaxID=2971236 RepID=UPI0021DF4FBA|nr:YwqG family protein [Xanthomonas sp. CFBP 8445]UYC10691.1 YwqG family protein [Xanthomonas sp. CFBP 8445]
MKTSHAVAVSAAIGLGTAALLVLLLVGGGRWLLRMQHSATPTTASAAPVAPVADAEQLATGALAPYRARLQATRRPVLQLQLQPMAQDDRLASKVGGRPYWTGDKPYPHAADGQPLALLAQIDLARMPPLPGYPRQGMLQFFIGGDDFYGANLGDARIDLAALSEQRNFRVVYWPQPKASARQVEVPSPAADTLPFDPARPRAMRFDAGEETIGSSDVRFEQVLGKPLEEVAAAYASGHAVSQDTVDDALFDALSRGGHKLGGYPEFTQEDPRTPQDRQVLLLQLDSDEEMMWGDSGVANFFIDPDDLRRGDFSRVAYNWDCF